MLHRTSKPRASLLRSGANRAGFTLIEIVIITSIVMLLIIIAAPGFLRARVLSRARSCQENLQKIDSAKEQLAKERRKKQGDSVTQGDLDGNGNGKGYLSIWPQEPSGYMYSINAIGTQPVCMSGLPGHSLSAIGKPIPAN